MFNVTFSSISAISWRAHIDTTRPFGGIEQWVPRV